MYEEELRVAIEATREAGAEVMRLRDGVLRYGRKGGWELVSEADVKAAEILHERLMGAFPEDGWLSEEHVDTNHRLDCERLWVVDPIDGTREFLMGVPEFAISVGFTLGGKAKAGVVFNPATGELFSAAVDGETPPALPSKPPGKKYDVLVGRGEQEWDEIPPLPAGARTRGVGSVAYRLALIAAGKGDAVVSGYGRNEWDVAAGAALCLAAGLTVSDALGDPMRFNQPVPHVRGLLIAEPALHRRIREHFAEHLM